MIATDERTATDAAPAGVRGARLAGPLAALADARLEVPVLGGGVVRHVNLDVAASAPAFDAVAAHVARVLPYYASVHRGSGYPSQAVDRARRRRARARSPATSAPATTTSSCSRATPPMR